MCEYTSRHNYILSIALYFKQSPQCDSVGNSLKEQLNKSTASATLFSVCNDYVSGASLSILVPCARACGTANRGGHYSHQTYQLFIVIVFCTNYIGWFLQVFYDKVVVKQVDVPSFSGAFGILPKHVPTLGKICSTLVVKQVVTIFLAFCLYYFTINSK